MPPQPQSSLRTQPRWEIFLDDLRVEVPPERCSVAGIRCYLETLAFQRQRLLSSFTVEPSGTGEGSQPGKRVQARTLSLEQFPLELIQTAREQSAAVRARVESVLLLVTINANSRARELWWEVAQQLKEPVVTLSVLSEASLRLPAGRVSLLQLRKWQLEQLGAILQEVDQVAWGEDPVALSEALEHRVLPWLVSLEDGLELLHETFLAGLAVANPGGGAQKR